MKARRVPLGRAGLPSAVETGPAPRVLLCHGAGSSADFVMRAFAAPLAAVGLGLVSWDLRRGAAMTDHAADFALLAERPGVRLVGGISLGAALAASWAAGRSVDGLLLALPAWTGPAGDVADLSRQAAAEVRRDGMARVIERTAAAGSGWVADELARAWRRYSDADLVSALDTAAGAAAPSLADLRRVEAPAGLVALIDDPFHPVSVARTWAATLPRAALSELHLQAPASDREAIGRAAVAAWLRAGGRPAISAR